MQDLGTHLLLDMVGCSFQLLDDIDQVRSLLLKAATEARATVLGHSFHKFSPQGVSGVVVIAESHISIHTWPEQGYAALDIFTCGDHAMPYRAVEFLIDAFAPKYHQLRENIRGIPPVRESELNPSGLQAQLSH